MISTSQKTNTVTSPRDLDTETSWIETYAARRRMPRIFYERLAPRGAARHVIQVRENGLFVESDGSLRIHIEAQQGQSFKTHSLSNSRGGVWTSERLAPGFYRVAIANPDEDDHATYVLTTI